MMLRVEMDEKQAGLLEVKRFYFPAIIYSVCPNCGEERSVDGTDEYISYGGLGYNEVHFSCYVDDEECAEWSETVYITLNVEPTDEPQTNVEIYDKED